MTSSTSSTARLGRRGFLGASASTAAAAAAACATAPALAAAATASRGMGAPADRERRTVGVLLPESSRYPTLSAEFLAGLSGGAAASGLPAPRWLPLPYGRSARAAVRQAQAAVQSGSVDALAGWLPADAAADLVPLLQQHAVPFLASDTGADRPSSRPAARSPWLVPHTLALWQSCAVLGREAPRRWGTRAVLCMGFLESGYDFPHEFRAAFEAAGGTVAAVHVSGLPDGRAEFDGLVAALKGTSADFVVALYSGRQAGRFRAAWQRLGMEGQRPPVLGLPFAHGGLLTSSATAAALQLGTDAGERLAQWQAAIPEGHAAALAWLGSASPEPALLPAAARQHVTSGWTTPYLVT